MAKTMPPVFLPYFAGYRAVGGNGLYGLILAAGFVAWGSTMGIAYRKKPYAVGKYTFAGNLPEFWQKKWSE